MKDVKERNIGESILFLLNCILSFFFWVLDDLFNFLNQFLTNAASLFLILSINDEGHGGDGFMINFKLF